MNVKYMKIKLGKIDEIEIEMENGEIVYIDRNNLLDFARYKWYVVQGRGRSKYLKANIIENGLHTTTEFHRYIMGKKEGFEIDHINHNGLDNRKRNLRFVTHKENQNNFPEKTKGKYSSIYKGVYLDKSRSRWVANINLDGKSMNLGSFLCERDAAIAFNNFVILNNLPRKLNEVV